MGKILAEVSASPHDAASVLRLAQAIDDLTEQVEKLRQRVEAVEFAVTKVAGSSREGTVKPKRK